MALICLPAFSLQAQAPLQNYSSSDYTLDRILSGKQIRKVGVDRHGYYWFTVPPATLIRWNGREARIIQEMSDGSPIDTAFLSFPQRTRDNDLIWCHPTQRRRWMQVDSTGALVLRELPAKDPRKVYWSYFGTAGVTNMFKLAPEVDSVERNLWSSMVDDWRNTYKFDLGNEALYNVSTDFIYHFKNGRLKRLPGQIGWLHEAGCAVGQHWLSVQANQFQLFRGDQLVQTGPVSVLSQIVQPGRKLHVWEAQFVDQETILGVDNQLLRLRVLGDRLEVQPLLTLPVNHGFTTFFWNERTRQFLLSRATGGFVIFEPQLFRLVQPNSLTGLVMYGLDAAKPTSGVTNLSFFPIWYSGKPDRFSYNEQSAFVWNAAAQEFYYVHSRKLYVLSASYQIKQVFPVDIGICFSMLLTDSALYFHTTNLYQFDWRNRALKRLSQERIDGKQMVQFVASYSKGKLLVARDDRIFQLDLATNQWQSLYSPAIPSIRSLAYDPEINRLLITTNGAGLFIINPETKTAVRPQLTGFPELMFAHYFLKDVDGDYWLPTNSGLFYCQQREIRSALAQPSYLPAFKRFGKSFGLPDEEFNGGFSNAGVIRNDTLYLSSMAGIVGASVVALKNWGVGRTADITLDGIWIDKQRKRLTDLHGVPHNFRRILLQVDFPFAVNQTVQLRYRILGGLDTSWYPVPDHGEIALTNIRPGDYQLEVNATNPTQIGKPLSLAIHVLRPWFLQWWAWLLYVSGVVILTYFLVKGYYQRKRNEALENLNDFRKRMLALVGHDLRSPIVSHRALAQSIPYLLEQGDLARIQQVGHYLYASSNSLELLVQNLVQWGKSDAGDLVVDAVQVQLTACFWELQELYRFHADTHQVDIRIDMPDGISITTDKNMLLLVLRNLIDNAIKNAASQSTVQLRAVDIPEAIQFHVNNEVEVPDPALIDRINIFLAGDRLESNTPSGWEIGLLAVREAAHRLGGTVNLEIRGHQVLALFELPKWPARSSEDKAKFKQKP